jgi:predicted nucleic acid-binding protein
MICFDTQTLIWGVQAYATPGQEDMVARARRYIAFLQKQNERLMVPAPVVAEYLAGFEPEKQQRQLQQIEHHFVVAAFDIHAATLAAQILARRPEVEQLQREDYEGRRQKLRIDVFIVATAIAHAADALISHDPGLVKLSTGSPLKVQPIPERLQQTELFDPTQFRDPPDS